MKEINLIVSQEKLEQNKINKLLQQKTRKNYKSYEYNIKRILISLMAVLIFILNLWLLGTISEKGVKGCMENGYSESYCIQHS